MVEGVWVGEVVAMSTGSTGVERVNPCHFPWDLPWGVWLCSG